MGKHHMSDSIYTGEQKDCDACLPKQLYLILPKRPGLVLRQHAEVSSFHVHIHGLTGRTIKKGFNLQNV